MPYTCTPLTGIDRLTKPSGKSTFRLIFTGDYENAIPVPCEINREEKGQREEGRGGKQKLDDDRFKQSRFYGGPIHQRDASHDSTSYITDDPHGLTDLSSHALDDATLDDQQPQSRPEGKANTTTPSDSPTYQINSEHQLHFKKQPILKTKHTQADSNRAAIISDSESNLTRLLKTAKVEISHPQPNTFPDNTVSNTQQLPSPPTIPMDPKQPSPSDHMSSPSSNNSIPSEFSSPIPEHKPNSSQICCEKAPIPWTGPTEKLTLFCDALQRLLSEGEILGVPLFPPFGKIESGKPPVKSILEFSTSRRVVLMGSSGDFRQSYYLMRSDLDGSSTQHLNIEYIRMYSSRGWREIGWGEYEDWIHEDGKEGGILWAERQGCEKARRVSWWCKDCGVRSVVKEITVRSD